MTIDYGQRLAELRLRRSLPPGTQRIAKAGDSAFSRAFAEAQVELYDTRGKSDPVRYALGCMQELGPEATQISVEEGNRVRDQLHTGLQAARIPVTFEYQGSVPLNIHIRSSSDIDLLVLSSDVHTFDPAGPRGGSYVRLDADPVAVLSNLRANCEQVLQARYHAADVDTTGAKSVAISGGSLRRKVDVVPSMWHDDANYQTTSQKHDRVVQVLDKPRRELLNNLPFLHMKKIHDKDVACKGGARKVIRLLKSLKRDSNHDLSLSSYEIAGLVWHLESHHLIRPDHLELSLVGTAKQFLQQLVSDPTGAKSLVTPDGSRKIIDSQAKLQAIASLQEQVDDLALAIVQGLKPFIYPSNENIQRELGLAQV